MVNTQTNGQTLLQDTVQTFQTTLNGYDQATAQAMIANFAQYYTGDNNPKSVTAWYSITDLNNIYTLLNAEAHARGTDGVRFYFGCNPPANAGDPLNLSILLVATENRVPPTQEQSNHGSYYDHSDLTAAYLANGPFGVADNNNAANAVTAGASYYGSTQPTDSGCSDPSGHYIDTPTVYQWISNRNIANITTTNSATIASPLNTKAEWFPFCFIESLFYSIINAPSALKLDGLRIYLGNGYSYKGQLRDVLILVPTCTDASGNHADYNGCLANLLQASPCGDTNFTDPTTSAFPARAHAFAKYRKAVKGKSPWYGGGYDNGELCPTNCD